MLTNNVDLIPKQVYISDVATFNRANYYGGQMLKFHDANWSDIIPDTDYDAIIARNPNKNLYYLFMNTAALPYLRSPYMRDDDGVFQDNCRRLRICARDRCDYGACRETGRGLY